MAQKFADIYKKQTTTVYQDMSNLLIILGKMNSAVDIKEDLAPNGATDGSTSKFTLQRRVRNVVKTVNKPNSGKTADQLALLDSFEKAKWESTNLVTGVAKSIGWIRTINDDFDMDKLNSKDADNLKMQVTEIALERNETLWAAIDAKAKTNAAPYKVTLKDGTQSADITVPSLPVYVKGETKVWDAIATGAIAFNKIDDKFKARSRAIIFVSELVSLELAKEMGTSFNQEVAIAQTGFKTGYAVNGNPVVVDVELTGRKVYFIDVESLVFKKSPSMANVDQKLGTNHYVGKVFYDIVDVADENRVWKLLPPVVAYRSGSIPTHESEDVQVTTLEQELAESRTALTEAQASIAKARKELSKSNAENKAALEKAAQETAAKEAEAKAALQAKEKEIKDLQEALAKAEEKQVTEEETTPTPEDVETPPVEETTPTPEDVETPPVE